MKTNLQKAQDFLSRAQESFRENLLPDTVECVEYAFKYAVNHVESKGECLPPELQAKVNRREAFQTFIVRMGNCWSDTINEDPEEVAFLLQAAGELVQYATAL